MDFLYDFESQILNQRKLLTEVSLSYVYKIILRFDSSSRNMKSIFNEVDSFFNIYTDKHQGLYISRDSNGIVLLIQTNHNDLDSVLFKLSTSCSILTRYTKNEFNKEVRKVNKIRRAANVKN